MSINSENQLTVPYTQTEKDKLTTVSVSAEPNLPIANTAQAEAGADNSTQMTPLRVKEAILALTPGGGDLLSTNNLSDVANTTTARSNLGAASQTALDALTTDVGNLVSADGSIGTHSDVSLAGISSGQFLQWNGSSFVGATVSGGSGPSDTDGLPEGSTNLYFTNARADARIASASIDDLDDVETTGVSDGQVLTYSGSNSRWEAAAATGGSGSNSTVIIKLGSGATIADKVSNAPVGGIPAGYTLVNGTNGSVDGQLTGSADDLVIIHGQGKVAVNPGIVSLDTLFGGHLNRPITAGDLKTESNNENQTKITDYNVLVGTGASIITFDLV